MRSVLAMFAFIAVVVAGVSVLASGDGAASAQEGATVTMGAATGPAGGGDQTGTATLTAMGSQTEIVVSIDASPDGVEVEQPGHVHAGTCDNLGSVEYPLTNVVDGASTTVIDASLESLQTGDFSINIHKSGDELGVYVSCGDILAVPSSVPDTGGNPVTDGGGLLTLTYLLLAAGAVAIVGGGAMGLAARRSR